MSLPSLQAVEITKLFLFGTSSSVDFLSDSRIRPEGEKTPYSVEHGRAEE
jgi:hypothetical protein